MPNHQPFKDSTLVIAALLVLGLVFAGYWITTYVNGGNPWALLPWFGIAAAVIIALGFFSLWRRGGGEGGK
jgi:hypothetical protein